MRNRMINTDMLDSRSLGRVSMAAQLLFVLLLMVVDDEGLALYDPPMLRRRLFGNRDEVGEEQVREWIGELLEEDCVRLYAEEDDRGEEAWWIAVTNFYYYQAINRPTPSKCPPPPWDHRPDNGEEGSKRVKRRCERLCGKVVDKPVDNERSWSTHGGLTPNRKEKKRRERKEPPNGSFPFSSGYRETAAVEKRPSSKPPRRIGGAQCT